MTITTITAEDVRRIVVSENPEILIISDQWILETINDPELIDLRIEDFLPSLIKFHFSQYWDEDFEWNEDSWNSHFFS